MLMGKQIILVESKVILFLLKNLLEQILFFSTLQPSFREVATMPVISD